MVVLANWFFRVQNRLFGILEVALNAVMALVILAGLVMGGFVGGGFGTGFGEGFGVESANTRIIVTSLWASLGVILGGLMALITCAIVLGPIYLLLDIRKQLKGICRDND